MAVVLAASFVFAVLCAVLGAPGQALASVDGCSDSPADIMMEGCERPVYLCDFDLGTNSLSYGAFSSARFSDSLKSILGLSLGGRSIDASDAFAPPGAREWEHLSPARPGKVSVRLFNSALNL